MLCMPMCKLNFKSSKIYSTFLEYTEEKSETYKISENTVILKTLNSENVVEFILNPKQVNFLKKLLFM